MLSLVKRPKSPYWIARGTINGQRVERSTGETSKPQARLAAERLEAAILEAGTARAADAWQHRPFAQALSDYIDHGGETRFLHRLLEHFRETPLAAIDNAMMARAAAALYPTAQPATIRRQLYTPVKAILALARDDQLRSPKGDPARTEWLWPDQAEALIRAATTSRNAMLAALITGYLGQGFRPGEPFLLDARRDVQLGNRFARLVDTKNGEAREVHLIGRTVAAWSTLPTLGRPGPLFLRRDGRPYTPRTGRGGHIRNPFRACAQAAGLDPARVTPHVLRHTWATWFHAVTLDVTHLKAQGGWKSNQWQRYTRTPPPGLAEAVLAHGWDFREVVGEKWGNGEPVLNPSLAKTGA